MLVFCQNELQAFVLNSKKRGYCNFGGKSSSLKGSETPTRRQHLQHYPSRSRAFLYSLDVITLYTGCVRCQDQLLGASVAFRRVLLELSFVKYTVQNIS